MNALFIYLKIYKLKQFKNLPYFVYKKKLIAQDQIFYYMCFPKNNLKGHDEGFGLLKIWRGKIATRLKTTACKTTLTIQSWSFSGFH